MQQADILFTCIIFVIGVWVGVRQSFGCIWQVNHKALRVVTFGFVHPVSNVL